MTDHRSFTNLWLFFMDYTYGHTRNSRKKLQQEGVDKGKEEAEKIKAARR